MKATRLNKPVHWFVTSWLGWESGDNLEDVLGRQRRADCDSAGPHRPSSCVLWRVPGTNDAEYELGPEGPDVEGALCIATIYYEDNK